MPKTIEQMNRDAKAMIKDYIKHKNYKAASAIIAYTYWSEIISKREQAYYLKLMNKQQN